MNQPKKPKGGKQPGSGRPPKLTPGSKPRTIRCTDEQFEKVNNYLDILRDQDEKPSKKSYMI